MVRVAVLSTPSPGAETAKRAPAGDAASNSSPENACPCHCSSPLTVGSTPGRATLAASSEIPSGTSPAAAVWTETTARVRGVRKRARGQ
eukprot:10520825-Lingulodinium_polyedra.AAC.1